MADVEVWGQDPEMNQKLAVLSSLEIEAERAKNKAALILCALTIKATQVVEELLENPDPQVRARAADLVYSRTIPKVASKHIDEGKETIDSADTASMRESIRDIILKGKTGE